MVSSTRGVRITGEERQQLMLSYVRRYQAGESIRSLAVDTNRSYGFVQGLLKEAGVPLRSRGGATRGAEAEADRKERQARVEAVRTAERADLAAAEATPVEPAQEIEPAEPDTSVEPGFRIPPGSAVMQADTEIRDLHRSPTSPADWGLPTPPLGVLVPKKDKAKAKAKRIAAKKAKSGGGPRHVRELVAARDAAARDEEKGPAPETGKKAKEKDAAGKKKDKGKKDKGKKDKAKKKDKGKKDKGKKDKAKKDKSAKGGPEGQGRSQKPAP